MDSVLIVLHSEANTHPLIQLLNKWGLGIKASCFFVDRLGGGRVVTDYLYTLISFEISKMQ